MKYSIKTERPQQQYLQITAEIDVASEPCLLQFPSWRPGRYELGNFAKNIRAFQVFDFEGLPLNFEKTNVEAWRIETNGAKKIVVKYDYYAAELNAGSTFLDVARLYVNPVNCLVYVKGKENEACTLDFNLHAEMTYTGTLPLEQNKLSARSYHELVDSPFIFCDEVESNDFEYGGVNFKISFVGVKHVPWERVLSDFKKFTSVQFDDFGSFPVETFHFIVLVTPYPHYHGVEHLASTIIVLGPSVDLFGTLYDELLGISSHELYHVWNVKAIRSVDLFPYDYSRQNFSKMGYLCEGITTYLGDYYLMASGLWSTDRYLKEFSTVIQKHLDNPGRFNYSLAESSWDTWLDGYVLGAPGRKVSIYNEGAIFAFLTDVFIRMNSTDQFNLSHVMRTLYQEFYCQGKAVSEQDFVHVVNTFSGKKFDDTFNSIVYQRGSCEEEIILGLSYLGLELNMTSNPDIVARQLGLKTTIENGAHRIAAISPGSISDHAGLMIGDRFWALNGHVVRAELPKWLDYFIKDDWHFIIERNGKVLQFNLAAPKDEYYRIVSIKAKNVVPTEKNIRLEKWSRKTVLSGID